MQDGKGSALPPLDMSKIGKSDLPPLDMSKIDTQKKKDYSVRIFGWEISVKRIR